MTLPNVRIEDVRVKRNLKVVLESGGREATATFNAVIEGQDKHQQMGRRPYPFFFTVHFRREGDAWRVFECDYRDPTANDPLQ
ncbi:MAG: hypothetical protein R3E01_23880 [Pirellulaceae bacterium]